MIQSFPPNEDLAAWLDLVDRALAFHGHCTSSSGICHSDYQEIVEEIRKRGDADDKWMRTLAAKYVAGLPDDYTFEDHSDAYRWFREEVQER